MSSRSDSASWTLTRDVLAVTSITASDEGGQSSQGTGTHIGGGYVITALHVVASSTSEPKFFQRITLQFQGYQLMFGAVVRTLWDRDDDWAVLRICLQPVTSPISLENLAAAAPLGKLLGTLPSLPISELRPDEDRVMWKSYGFPQIRPAGMNVSGEVTGQVPMGGTHAIQLYSKEASAGNGVAIQGLSGAPVIVERSVVGIIRSAIVQHSLTVGGTLFATPISALPTAPDSRTRFPDDFPTQDIYRGLPGIARQDLPQRPFRYLERYTERDADVFFGRKAILRSLYDAIVADDADPILLIYGQSGIGKSSLLDAGLLPRLRATHAVRFVRRDEAGSLAGALSKATGGNWRNLETSTGLPLLVIIDQVEETFTRGSTDPALELRELIAQLQADFREHGTRPRGRLCLSLRKEWLADIQNALEIGELPYSKHFVERLTHTEIIEVVEGLTLTSRLRRHYNVSVEAGLGDRIAADLLVDPGSAITPMLQIWMTRLWERCKDEQARRSLRVEAYQQLRREETELEDFVRLQLSTLEPSLKRPLESGLVEDLLEFHTNRTETARTRAFSETTARYASSLDLLSNLLRALVDAFLLTSIQLPGGNLGYRLSHDTLGPVVRARFQESQRPGQRARRIIEARVAQGHEFAPLDAADLATVEVGRTGMRDLTPQECRVLSASRRARWKNRVAGIGALGLTAFLVVILSGLVLPQIRVPAFHHVHSWTLSAAADAALAPRTDYQGQLGRQLASYYACDWYQSFQTGEIIHPSQALFALDPGSFERTAFVLQNNISGLDDRWYWYHGHPVRPIPYSGVATFIEVAQKAAVSADDLGFAPLHKPNSKDAALSTLCCTDTDHEVQGGMAFFYAKLNLRHALGDPDGKQFQSSVLIRSYEHGYVLAGVGGYPLESDVVDILIEDNDSSERGSWFQLIQKPLFGSALRPNCVAGTS